MSMIDAEFPDKLRFLFWEMRHKVARGGRSGAKSWGFARALLIKGFQESLRILVAREIQKSIKDSVHQLMKDQIKLMGLESKYDVLETEIRGKDNDTRILYTGLAEHTVTTIKSFESIDICWVEEAQVVSKRSWDILIPTIRKARSEIWISYNPELETDETHQRFTIHPPHDCANVEINWRDNPWHNEVMEKERLRCKRDDPDNYDNIWEGKCKPAVEGAIYYKEIMSVEAQNRVCNVPYDPMLKVHVVLDLGWEDSLAAGLVQKGVSDVRVIEYIECNHTSLPAFASELKTRPYNWGKIWPPHDGYSGRLESGGKSTYDILRAQGGIGVAKKSDIVELSIEEGIRQARLLFPRMYFDQTKAWMVPKEDVPKPKTEGFHPTEFHNRLGEPLKRYRRHINQTTQAASGPVKDAAAHGADMLRYIACNIDKMTNEEEHHFYQIPGISYQPHDEGVGM